MLNLLVYRYPSVRIVLILWFTISCVSRAEAYFLDVKPIDAPLRSLPDYKKNVKDSLEASRQLAQLLSALHEQSYLAAQIDTLIFHGDTTEAYLIVGEKYSWVNLRKGNIDGYLLDHSGFKEKFYRDNPFRYAEYNKLERSFIKLSENNGFPFASIQLDSISLINNRLSAALNYQKGPFFSFDSINIIGKTKTKKRYLMRHLRISKGMPYSQQRIDETERLLRELPFLTQVRPPEVVFSKNTATLNLFLADKKINQIDGIVGFLPNEGNNRRLLLTGELNLGLRNVFGTGKALNLEWRKIKQASQTLDIAYTHPKMLGSSVDVKVNFNLFKQDSTFLTIVRRLNFIQRTGSYGKVSIIAGLRTSRPLNAVTDTSKIKFADYNHYTYGLGYDWNNLNNIFYPRRGWLFSIQGSMGNKTIRPNPAFAPSYYEGAQLKSVQFNLDGTAERYTKLGKGSVLLTKISAGHIFNNPANLFFNDLYRVGGLRSLRGFNESNFFASAYAVATLEYRFFTDETSYLLLFYDQGYLVNKLDVANQYDYPLGFGAGVSFTTQAGVFNFIYSLGNSNNQEVSLNLSKIHFGITSRF